MKIIPKREFILRSKGAEHPVAKKFLSIGVGSNLATDKLRGEWVITRKQ